MCPFKHDSWTKNQRKGKAWVGEKVLKLIVASGGTPRSQTAAMLVCVSLLFILPPVAFRHHNAHHHGTSWLGTKDQQVSEDHRWDLDSESPPLWTTTTATAGWLQAASKLKFYKERDRFKKTKLWTESLLVTIQPISGFPHVTGFQRTWFTWIQKWGRWGSLWWPIHAVRWGS